MLPSHLVWARSPRGATISEGAPSPSLAYFGHFAAFVPQKVRSLIVTGWLHCKITLARSTNRASVVCPAASLRNWLCSIALNVKGSLHRRSMLPSVWVTRRLGSPSSSGRLWSTRLTGDGGTMEAVGFAQQLVGTLTKHDPRAGALCVVGNAIEAAVGLESPQGFVALLVLAAGSTKCNVMSLFVPSPHGKLPTLKRGTPAELADVLAGPLKRLWADKLPQVHIH